MAPRPTTPRITPLPKDEQSDDQRELLAVTGRGRPLNIFLTLVRAPGLFRRWSPFGGKLLNGGKLPARDRELVILRVAWRCECAYEWGQHVSIAREAGVADDEIRRVAVGADAPGWSAHETALLRAVDELHDDHCITDATWQALAVTYTTEQMIELPMLAGHYALLAGALNSFGVQLESEAPALGDA